MKNYILDEGLDFDLEENGNNILWSGKPITNFSFLMLIRAIYNIVIIAVLCNVAWSYSHELDAANIAVIVVIAILLPIFLRALWDVFLDIRNYINRYQIEYVITKESVSIRSGVNDNLYVFDYENIGHVYLNRALRYNELGNITLFLKKINKDYINMSLEDYRNTREIKLENLEESVKLYLLLNKLVKK